MYIWQQEITIMMFYRELIPVNSSDLYTNNHRGFDYLPILPTPVLL